MIARSHLLRHEVARSQPLRYEATRQRTCTETRLLNLMIERPTLKSGVSEARKPSQEMLASDLDKERFACKNQPDESQTHQNGRSTSSHSLGAMTLMLTTGNQPTIEATTVTTCLKVLPTTSIVAHPSTKMAISQTTTCLEATTTTTMAGTGGRTSLSMTLTTIIEEV